MCCQDLSIRFSNWKDIKNHLFFKQTDWNKMMKKELAPPIIPNQMPNYDIDVNLILKFYLISFSLTMTTDPTLKFSISMILHMCQITHSSVL